MKRMPKFSTIILVASVILFPFSGWAEMGHHGGGSHGDHGEHHHMETDGHRRVMEEVYGGYFAIQASLAESSMEKVPTRAQSIAEEIERFRDESVETDGHGHRDEMHALVTEMGTAAGALAKQKDITSARKKFGTLSEKLAEYHKNHGRDHSTKAHVFVCDMAKQVWLQDSEELRNPYFGSSMLKCGRKMQ